MNIENGQELFLIINDIKPYCVCSTREVAEEVINKDSEKGFLSLDRSLVKIKEIYYFDTVE